MVKDHIEVSDRGITLSKTLAWTIVTGLVLAAFWLGSEMRGTQEALKSLVAQQNDSRVETADFRRDTDRRIRILESSRASNDSELVALRRDVTSVSQDIRDMKELLERYFRPPTRGD